MSKLLEKLKEDPHFDERIEFGRMCMQQKELFTDAERKRYNELKEVLRANPYPPIEE